MIALQTRVLILRSGPMARVSKDAPDVTGASWSILRDDRFAVSSG
jgi:hypothetical protein